MKLPLCTVCGREVDRFEERDEPWLMRIEFTVRCHGASERHTIDYETMRHLKGLSFGLAFASAQRLLPPR